MTRTGLVCVASIFWVLGACGDDGEGTEDARTPRDAPLAADGAPDGRVLIDAGIDAPVEPDAAPSPDALPRPDAAPPPDAEPPPDADTIAPDTTIVGAPSPLSAISTATFELASDDPTATFECSLDGLAFAACASASTTPVLADGDHAFAARAVDAHGNTDATPASVAWTIDTVPPDTTIVTGPDELTRTATASFTLAGAVTYECSLDGGAWEACPGAFDLTVVPGEHHLAARGLDEAGNVDPTPATHRWTYDVDECAEGLDDCTSAARCVDCIGGYSCVGDDTPICFDGLDDRAITAPTSELALLDAATIELWFRARTASGEHELVDVETAPASARRVGVRLVDAAPQSFGELTGRVLMLAVDARDNGGALNVRGFDLDAALPGFDETSWHHYAVVFTGTTTQAFVDGTALTWAQQRDGSAAATFSDAFGPGLIAAGGTVRLGVGWFQRDGDRFLDGLVDDLRVSASARYSTPFTPMYPLDSDPATVLAIPFREGAGTIAADAGPHGLNLTLDGPRWGQCGSSLAFDGHAHAVVSASEAVDLDAHSYTVEAWIKPTAPSTWLHFIIAKKRRDVNDGWHVYRGGVGCDGIGTTAAPPGSPCGLVPIGVWTHVAITYDTTTSEKCIWIAGVARACGVTAPHEGTNDELVQLGNETDGYDETHFTGLMDEVRISSTVRYTTTFVPPTRLEDDGATIAAWHFDEGNGAESESVPSGYPAMLIGTTWSTDSP